MTFHKVNTSPYQSIILRNRALTSTQSLHGVPNQKPLESMSPLASVSRVHLSSIQNLYE